MRGKVAELAMKPSSSMLADGPHRSVLFCVFIVGLVLTRGVVRWQPSWLLSVRGQVEVM